MDIDCLYEFATLTSSRNADDAARTLGMSTDQLQEDMCAIEDHYGITLFEKGSLSDLTEVGAVFKKGIEPVLRLYTETIDECKQLSRNYLGYIVLQEIPYQTTVNQIIMNAFFKLSEQGLLVKASSYDISGYTAKEALAHGLVDIGFHGDGTHRNRAEVIAELQEEGYTAKYISTLRFFVRANKDHPIMQLDAITPADIACHPILIPDDKSYLLLRHIIDQAFEPYEIAHSFQRRSALGFSDFYFHPEADGIFLVDQDTARILEDSSGRMPIKPVSDESFGYDRYLIYRTDSKNPLLSIFANAVSAEE